MNVKITLEVTPAQLRKIINIIEPSSQAKYMRAKRKAEKRATDEDTSLDELMTGL